MKPERFDGLSAVVGTTHSRRRVIKLLAAGSVAGLVGMNTLPKAAAAGAVPGCGVQTLNLWLISFLRGEIPGHPRGAPAGPFAGVTAIPAPVAPDILGCFLTDQRSFSDLEGSVCAIQPSSRMSAMATVDLVNPAITFQDRCTSGTIEVDCNSGDVGCRANAEIGGEGFTLNSPTPTEIDVRLHSFAHDPCTPFPGPFVPDIDIDVTFTILIEQEGSITVSTHGAVDVFPAWEIYGASEDSGPVVLFSYFDPATRAGDLGTSQLAIAVDGIARLTNDATCDQNMQCCSHNQFGGDCCPGGSDCCPPSLGGGCCPNGMACCPPAAHGEHNCCEPGWSCCPDPTRQAKDGCCPPEQPLCCPPDTSAGGCCPPVAPTRRA